jgi:hypothetical protein
LPSDDDVRAGPYGKKLANKSLIIVVPKRSKFCKNPEKLVASNAKNLYP